jgi:F-type H+-transporting ATPase subunit epsilon
MNTFTLVLRDSTHSDRIEGVQSFVGEDASGAFGVLAQHGRMMTTLLFGLSRFRIGDHDWQYLATPGGVLYFRDQVLTINTRRYFQDNDFERISGTLQRELLQEEHTLEAVKRGVRRMEEEMLRRIRDLGREGAQLE